MTGDTRATEFWDREIVDPTHAGWLEHPPVREAVNRRISGNSGLWPLDWFESILNGRRFARALSIGCGGGGLERDLVQRGICGTVDAFDGSLQSLLLAQRTAAAAGLSSQIRYFAADFNVIALPPHRFDAVFFHQSLHHVERLEHLLGEVARSLVPGGIVYLDEYIGPSRLDWTDRSVAAHRRLFSELPARLRACDELPLPIQKHDPSEAVRSDEIVPMLEKGFDVQFRRDYGGNLLSVLYPFLTRAPEPELLQSLLAMEDDEISRGTSYHAIIVAQRTRSADSASGAYAGRSTYRRWRGRKFYRERIAPLAFRVRRKLRKILRGRA